MKKLILASAIATIAAAGTANAATVYEGKGLTYKIKGDWQVQLRQDQGNDQNLDVEFDDLEIKNAIAYQLNDNLKAIGELHFGFKDAAEDKQAGSDLEEAFVGFEINNTRVVVGKMDLASDEFGVEAAYEQKLGEDTFDEFTATSGDDVIRVDAEFDAVTVVASYEIDAEGESSENGEAFDLFVATKIAGVELAVAYQDFTPSIGADSVDTFGVSAAFDAGFAEIAADFSASDFTAGDIELLNLVVIVPVADKTKVALGMIDLQDDTTNTDATEWYANVTHKFANAKNVSVFAEISDTDETNVDMGYLAGMRIKF